MLPDGRVIDQDNRLLKNNAGFDLKQLLIGSEGVLGVIASVTFRLFPQREVVKTAICAAQDFKAVTDLLFFASKSFQGLSSFEVLWDDYMQELTAVTGRAQLFAQDYPFHILLEVEASEDTGLFETQLMKAVEEGVISDALIASNETQRQTFWGYRDGIADMLMDFAPNVNFDIGIPVTSMKGFTEDVAQALRSEFAGIRLVTFGHIGDGNIHICCTTGNESDQVPIEELVFAKTTAIGGTITAEHGIGILKKPWLKDCRSPEEIAVMKQLKALLDPENILNKGRVI